MQETHASINTREIRKHYTWFFAGENPGEHNRAHTEAGVAIVIDNNWRNYIWDIQPYSDRLISITLGYSIPVSFISTYMPTASAETEKKDKHYKALYKVQTDLQKKGPTYTGGDFNARVQIKQSDEENCIGQHTFDKANITLATQDDGVVENRNYFITITYAVAWSKLSNFVLHKRV